MKKFLITSAAVAGLVFSLAACSTSPVVDEPVVTPDVAVSEPAPVTSEAPVDNAPVSETSTLAMLNELTVAPENESGYDRDLFKHWTSNNPTGCDTRDAVLIREVVNGNVSGCNVSGTWVSVYDGVSTTDPGDFDIDHMVPLKEAWDSGAFAWDSATREAYANDMDYVYSLVGVSAKSNRSKSDQDPTSWMPTQMDGCDYVGRWVSVKHRWDLSVDEAEKSKILSVLSWCDGDYILPETPSTAPVTSQPVEESAPTTPEVTEPQTGTEGGTDPQFSSCKEAVSNGYGPYVKGTDPEYDWYQDRDGDGSVCE